VGKKKTKKKRGKERWSENKNKNFFEKDSENRLHLNSQHQATQKKKKIKNKRTGYV
jgi:hypothetical protein